MGIVSDPANFGELERRLRDLERQVQALQTARRLEAASIGAGGLRVKDGGKIEILDDDGEVTLTLAAEGLSLEGLLEVVGSIDVTGGSIRILDADGDDQMRLSTDGLTLTGTLQILAGLLEWEDDNGDVRLRIGQQGTNLWPDAESVRLIYTDDDEVQRIIVGEILDGDVGDLVGHGLLVQDADGNDILAARDGRALLAEGGGAVFFSSDFDDELDLFDEDGNFRATLGPVTWSGSSDGYGILVEDASGDARFFASDNRIWLRTTDGHTGEVTAGASDSGGAGFRLLRIPN